MRISTGQISQSAINAMMDRQVELSKTQLQLDTGKRVVKPSDDPVASATSLSLKQTKAITERYQMNADAAQTRLVVEETALENVGNIIQRIRELALQGNNATLSDEQRGYLAEEMRGLQDSLLQTGNTTDNNGQYLFAGNQGDTTPFVRTATGSFQYQGDEGQRLLQIGTTHRIADGDPGSAVFTDIRNGNGVFSAKDDALNSGSGRVASSTVVDKTLYADHSYTIDFVDNAGVMEYSVTDTTLGAVVVPATAYVPGSSIAFDGVSLTIDDQPADGDRFSVAPSERQDLFQTVQNLIDALESDTSLPGGPARLHNAVARGLNDMDNAHGNILNIRARIGTRMNSIDLAVNTNANLILGVEQTLSDLNDLDFAEAISRMNLQLTALQAAQQTYSKVQGLSLFNYI
jgi:flagellar hook-associated protein 3 FlgL